MTVDPRTVIRDKVAEAIHAADAIHLENSIETIPGYTMLAEAAIAAHLEALEQAARIETIEQLDALPNGSVVLDSEEGSWQRAWGFWYAGGNRDGCPASDVWLPARVLWAPEEDS